jgi:predicted esterase
MLMNRSLWLPCLTVMTAALSSVACSSSDSGGAAPATTGPLAVACVDSIDSVYGDPGELPADKGAIIRCAPDAPIPIDQVQRTLDGYQYKGRPMTSGAEVYRVLYRTERGNGAPGYSSAKVYLPDNPRAEKLPVIVVSHGSRGQAAKCAPSLQDPSAEQVNDDQERNVLTLVGKGFAVIAPDLAGYANYGAQGNPPSAYNSSADVSKSTLDAARALRKLVPGMFSEKVVITGHSQGGHIALSALAAFESYGADGELAALATFVPNWLTQRTWAALFLVAKSYPFATDPTPNVVSLWYHYTQAELLDGPGKGKALFKAEVRDAVAQFVDTTCWGGPYPALEAMGTTVKDIFDPTFVQSVMTAGGLGAPCPGDEPGKSICETWMGRYASDRPHIEGKAKQVPILIVYGGKDEVFDPNRFQCGLDRLRQDGANLEYCYDPDGMHGELPAQDGDYAADWIASKTLGTPIEAVCPVTEMNLVDAEGNPAKCTTPPPND